ncbi:hypothetical protein J6590_012001 [Homalodisca vitripennis]|nr:hypothetical protein J6590_012001 [Homalodisca vitripennis]
MIKMSFSPLVPWCEAKCTTLLHVFTGNFTAQQDLNGASQSYLLSGDLNAGISRSTLRLAALACQLLQRLNETNKTCVYWTAHARTTIITPCCNITGGATVNNCPLYIRINTLSASTLIVPGHPSAFSSPGPSETMVDSAIVRAPSNL